MASHRVDALLAIPDTQRRLSALNNAAWALRDDAPTTAADLAEAARALAEDERDSPARAKALATLTLCRFRQAEYDAAQAHGLELLRTLELDPAGDAGEWRPRLDALDATTREALSEAITALAIATFRLGNYAAALLHASKERIVKRYLGDSRGEATALHGIAWGYSKAGLFQQALAHHREALAILEEVATEAIASPLNGIAETYLSLGQLELALEYSERALAAADDAHEGQRARSTALRCIGMVRQRRGEVEAAREAFGRSIEISDLYGRALNLLSLGEMELELGDAEAALDQFHRCLEELDTSPRRRSRSQALTGVGNAELLRGDAEAAIEAFREAVRYAEAIDAPVEIYQAHLGLARAHKRLDDYGRALEHFETFHRYQEKVAQEASDIRTQVLMIEFDVERLVKDQEIYRLRHVELARAYDELKLLNAKLERQARELERQNQLDGLTGIYNRRYLDAALEHELARMRRSGEPLALMMADIDDFKLVNDRFSHLIGDRVLRRIAELLREHTRESDIVARYGGEELVVAFPAAPLEQAVAICEKLRVLVAEQAWEELAEGLVVTLSIGVVEARVDDTPGVLLDRADGRMYEAKAAGKDCVKS